MVLLRNFVFLMAGFALMPAISAAAQTPNYTADSVQAQITYLASDALRGRGSGEKGNELAAQFIAETFAKYGVSPLGTNHERDWKAKLDGSGYYQPFPFTAGRAVGKNNRLEAEYAGKHRTYRAGQDFEPSAISSGGKVEGSLVFAGYGIVAPPSKYDDYGTADVKGKIVMLLAGSPKDDPHSPLYEYSDLRRKALAARDKGASAVLVISPKNSGTQNVGGASETYDAGLPVLRLRYKTAQELFALLHGDLDSAVSDAAASRLTVVPVNGSVKINADVQKIEKITANVVGKIEGSDPALRNEVVVIGAHLDHLGMGGFGSLAKSNKPAIHHGADDNASGTAGVMQIAAYFAQPAHRPKRSLILMCFSGEELGLLGSSYYVSHPIVPLEKTVAMLNMDMIGRLKNNQLIVSGSGTASEWNPLLDHANETAKFDIARSESGFGASDHQSFYIKNIPVLFFFTGLHDDYHTPTDTADKINAAGEVRVLDFVTQCAESIADAPARPTFHQVQQAAQNSGARGFRVYFGSVPNYAYSGEGVLLDGVREGSPAEKGGVKAGDVILKFGDKTVKNVQDYSYALGDYKPGDTVPVLVKRGEQTLTLTVTLAARKE